MYVKASSDQDFDMDVIHGAEPVHKYFNRQLIQQHS